MIAWLHARKLPRRTGRESHFNARLGIGIDAADVSFERRSFFRAQIEADPAWFDARYKEHTPFPHEGAEPDGLP